MGDRWGLTKEWTICLASPGVADSWVFVEHRILVLGAKLGEYIDVEYTSTLKSGFIFAVNKKHEDQGGRNSRRD